MTYLPSEDEIAAKTEAIRNGWSREERRRRTGYKSNGPGIRVISTTHLHHEDVSDFAAWLYLTDSEASNIRKLKEIRLPAEVPHEELLEREMYQASQVHFG